MATSSPCLVPLVMLHYYRAYMYLKQNKRLLQEPGKRKINHHLLGTSLFSTSLTWLGILKLRIAGCETLVLLVILGECINMNFFSRNLHFHDF